MCEVLKRMLKFSSLGPAILSIPTSPRQVLWRKISHARIKEKKENFICQKKANNEGNWLKRKVLLCSIPEPLCL